MTIRYRLLPFIMLVPATQAFAAADADEDNQIVVTATRNPIDVRQAPASVTVVTAEDIENRNVSRITDALLKTPSLFLGRGENGQSSTLEGGFSLRGMTTQRTLVLLDGLQPLQNGNSQGVNWLTVFPEDIERVEVVPGAFGALYGSNAIGGVINIISKRADRREFTVRLRQGFGDAAGEWPGVYFRDRITPDLGIVLGGSLNRRRGFIGEFTVRTPVPGAPGTPVTGAIPTTTREGLPAFIVGDRGRAPIRQINAVARLEYDISPDHRIFAGLNYADADVGFEQFNTYLRNAAGQPVSSGTLGIGTQRITLSETNFVSSAPLTEASRRWFAGYEGKIGKVALRAEASRIYRDFSFPTVGATSTANAGPGTLTDVPNNSTVAAFTASLPVGNHLVVAGASYNEDVVVRRTYALTNWRRPDTRTTINNGYDGRTRIASVFLQDSWTPFDMLTVYGGLRVDRWDTDGSFFQLVTPRADIKYPNRGETSVNPKLSAVIRPTDTVVLRAAWGRSFRAPSNLDLYATTVQSSSVSPTGLLTIEGDPNLLPERATSWEVGGDWRPTDGVRLFANYYQTRLTDIIFSTQIDLSLTRRVNAGAGRVNGAEIGLTVNPWNWLAVDANMSFIDSRITANAADPGSVGKRLTQVPARLAYVGLTATPGNWVGVIEARYSGQTFITARNTDVVQGVPSSNDSFTMVNGKVGYRFTEALRVNVAVNNILDARIFQFGLLAGRNATAELVVSF
jgi:iron complex outermembrane receptor protein